MSFELKFPPIKVSQVSLDANFGRDKFPSHLPARLLELLEVFASVCMHHIFFLANLPPSSSNILIQVWKTQE